MTVKDAVIKAAALLMKKQLTLVTAESCTGGGLAHSISKVADYSSVLERGYVTYSKDSKHELLKVKSKTLENYGAVSKETAIEMAVGALRNSHAQISVAVTGLIGTESKKTEKKPLGTVYICCADRKNHVSVIRKLFLGTRAKASKKTLIAALNELYKFVSKI